MTQRFRSPVADNARRYRERHDMSLGEAARRASLSKATLSTLEAGTGNPTVATLAALAETFGIDPAMMLAAAPASGTRVLLRHSDADRPGTDDEPIDRFEAVGEVEIYDLRYEEGDGFGFDGHAAGTVERVIVLQGALEVGPLDDLVVLEAGDYLAFDASRRHQFKAVEGPVRATLIVAHPGTAPSQSPIHGATRRRTDPT